MLIFNTTYLVSDKIHEVWLKWVREKHIPSLIQSGFFTSPQLAKVLSAEEQDGTSYSVQYKVENILALENWHLQSAKEFELEVQQLFGADVIFFATVLELIQ